MLANITKQLLDTLYAAFMFESYLKLMFLKFNMPIKSDTKLSQDREANKTMALTDWTDKISANGIIQLLIVLERFAKPWTDHCSHINEMDCCELW